MSPPDDLLTTPEAAALLGVQPRAITRAANERGKLPVAGTRKGATGRPVLLFRRADVTAWGQRKQRRG